MEICYFCKGKVRKQTIQHVYHWGEKLFILEDVPAEVCQQCGETYFEPEVLEAMDKLASGEIKPKDTLPVPVFSLASMLPSH
jgi:YgiT-type zinc finger domain-containing protein